MNRVPVTDMWLGHSSVAARWGVSVLASVQSIPLGRGRTSLFPLKLAATGDSRKNEHLLKTDLNGGEIGRLKGLRVHQSQELLSCQPLRNSSTIVGNNEEVVASSSLTRNGFTATRAPTFRYFRQHHVGPSRCSPTMIRSRPRH